MKITFILPILSPQEFKELYKKKNDQPLFISWWQLFITGRSFQDSNSKCPSIFHVWNICAKPFHAHFFEALTA